MAADRWRRLRKTKSHPSFLIFLCPWLLAGVVAAQCPVTNPDDDLPPPLPTVNSSTRTAEPRLPESGYLSSTTYASAYFGFVIDLPVPLDGHRLMLPLMPPGQHALLAIGFQEGRRSGTLLITASEPPNPLHEMTEDERKAEFLAWSKGQPTHQITPPDWLTRTGRFYHIVKRTGDVTTVQYWTFIRNYLIRLKVSSNDAAFLRKTKEAVAGLKFYCPQDDGTLINEQGKTVPTPGEGYQGPTIPTAVVDQALADRPALEFIERGAYEKGTYHNESIGLTVEYSRWGNIDHDDPPSTLKGDSAQRTRDLLDACSLTLFRLTDNQSPGVFTLRALDQTCLGLPAPMSSSDTLGAEALGAYLNMIGILGEVRSSRLVEHGNQLFAGYRCFASQATEDRSLAHREVQAAAITRHRKLLLVWTWTAPSAAELAAMPMTVVSFENGPAIELSPAQFANRH